MRVVSSEEMKAIEVLTTKDMGFGEARIIENVGGNAAEFIESRFVKDNDFSEIIVFVGKGYNGANGLCIARHLTNKGYSVRAFLLFAEDEFGPIIKEQLEFARHFGVKVNNVSDTEQIESYFTQTGDSFLVIDAILGMGFIPPLSNYLFDVVNLINDHATIVVCVDAPTGVSGDNGQVKGNAIRADYTMAIGLPKLCHYVGEGAEHSGKLVVIEAGYPYKTLIGGDKHLLSAEESLESLKGRNKFGHKNSFGHCLVVGGSPGLTGAVIMSSLGALKVGTGLVTASTWKESYAELCSRIVPEVMTGLIPTVKEAVDDIIKDLNRWDSIVLGPGLGRDQKSREVVLQVLNHFAGPVVVDADAIRVLNLEEDDQVLAQRKWPTILTPHMGEFADFAKVDKEDVLENPMAYLRKLVDRTNSCILLKGACSYLGLPNGDIFINYFPNDGMASGGSGDVLSGILGGLLAQSPMEVKTSSMFADKQVVYDSIKLAIIVHTLSGKHASVKEGARSMTAMSLVNHLSDAFKELEEV